MPLRRERGAIIIGLNLCNGIPHIANNTILWARGKALAKHADAVLVLVSNGAFQSNHQISALFKSPIMFCGVARARGQPDIGVKYHIHPYTSQI